MTLGSYKRYLELFYGFIKPMEAVVLQDSAISSWGLNPERLAKAPLLEADFRSLGYSEPEIAALPMCSELPDVSLPSRMLGYVYVMEGSTLGGQIISKKLAAAGLELSPEAGLAYFYAYGPDTRTRWMEIRELLLKEGSNPQDADEMVQAAQDTFTLLDAWIHKGAA